MSGYKRLATIAAACGTLLLAHAAHPNQATAQPPKIESSSPSVMSKLNPMNWSMPKLLPEKSPTSNVKKVSQRKLATREPDGFWASLGKKSRSTWNKTTDVLNPFDDKPKKKSVSKKSPGFFDGIFAPKPKPRPVETVGDFLQQKHPY